MSTIEEHDKEQNACIDIDDAGRTDYDNELVTRSAPRWAWDVIDETLALDMSSSAFDKELRKDIHAACAEMTHACEEPEPLCTPMSEELRDSLAEAASKSLDESAGDDETV